MAGRKTTTRAGAAGVFVAVLLAIAQFTFGGTLEASASSSCTSSTTCRWTQLLNNNWQPGSGSPYCNPCVKWPTNGSDFSEQYWNPWAGQGSMFERDLDWAVNTWSSLQYNTPVFFEANTDGCGCGVQLNVGATNLGGACGVTYLNTSGSTVTGATVDLNSAHGYIDGPTNQSGGCDAKHDLLHELGHVFTEGHSSIQADLMYPNDNSVEAIDQDANNMLAAVYGTYEGGCSDSYCGNADVDPPVYLNNLTPGEVAQAVTGKVEDAAGAAGAAGLDSPNEAVSEGGQGVQEANQAQSDLCSKVIHCTQPPPQ